MAADLNSSEDEPITDINITPFVDVVLVLLVIFMVTAPMMVQKVLEVQLPSSESVDQVDPETIAVAITSTGQFLLNGQITTKSFLLESAKSAVDLNKDVQVLIAADQEAAHKHVVSAIDVIKQAGVENFAFQINKQDSELSKEQDEAKEVAP